METSLKAIQAARGKVAPETAQAATGEVSAKAIQTATGKVSTKPATARPALPPVDDFWICGYAALAEEFERRGIPVKPITLKRMCARGDFPKSIALTGSPDSKAGRRGWRQSTVVRWFTERDRQAAA